MIFSSGKKIVNLACALYADTRGMTLIDMAIALMVLSLLLVPLAQAYNVKRIDDARSITITNTSAVYKAISDFFFEQGRYPCPARLDLGPDDANYGAEDCTGLTNGTANTRFGGVPFKALKIPADFTLDGWARNKLTYVVTRNQTNAATFVGNQGRITVQEVPEDLPNQCSDRPPELMPAGTNVHLILISHGPTGQGGWTAEGDQISACPAANAARDSANCDHTANAVYLFHSCVGNSNAGPDFYDDQIARWAAVPQRIWAVNSVDTNDIFSDRNNITAIGINNPNPTQALDVVGNIRVSGNTDARLICDSAGGNCMTPNLIAGDEPSMECPPGAASTIASGIKNGKVICDVGFLPDFSEAQCEDGHYMIGITPTGDIVCSP
jgi:type II secretory pathway pseudopilin PulG